jgi:alkylated DNA nucleotide flippase Atl1
MHQTNRTVTQRTPHGLQLVDRDLIFGNGSLDAPSPRIVWSCRMPTHVTRTRRSAVAKRDGAPAPRVETLHEAKGPGFPAGRMLIASPQAIADVVSTIPEGRVLTFPMLRAALARQYDADYACPVTTGIFLRVAAEAALEEGRADHLPVWRIVREDGACLDKFVGGPDRQAERLRAEGIEVERRRTRWYVRDVSGERADS